MSVRGNAAPRGMTAHDRIRLTGPFAEYQVPIRQVHAVWDKHQPRPGNPRSGLTIFSLEISDKQRCRDPIFQRAHHAHTIALLRIEFEPCFYPHGAFRHRLRTDPESLHRT